MSSRIDKLVHEDSSARAWLIVAVVATVVGAIIPFGHFALYPFSLFETFVHEACHALAAVVTGGHVDGMNVNWDTSGLTLTRGGWQPAISSAGYLGSALVGAALLLAARRAKRAPAVLLTVGALTVAATFVFAGYGRSWIPILGFGLGASLIAYGRACRTDDRPGEKYTLYGGLLVLGVVAYLALSGGLLTWTVGLLIGLTAIAVASWAPRWMSHGALMFLGVHNSLDALGGVKTLVGISVSTDRHSDAVNMAHYTGVPSVVWALAWAVLAVAIVGGALWLFWRDDRTS